MSDLKHRGKSQKHQGKNASSNSMSDMRMKPGHRLGRGLGSEFANAVGNVMEDAKNIKGSKNGFLGVESKSIDPREFSHSLNKKK